MMATLHTMADAADAAAAGRALPSQWLAYRAESVSQFRLDLVRHIDFCDLFGVEHSGPTCLEAALGVTNFLTGALGVVLVATRQPPRRAMMGGAPCGIVVDLSECVPQFATWSRNWAGAAWLTGRRHRIQHDPTPAQWGLRAVTQVAALGLWSAVCLAGTNSARRTPGARAASV